MEKNKILLINDMPGYGKVALTAMVPILSHMKFDLHNLPTALVSNTLDYGKFEILDTTEYMKNTIEVWDELGFSFDAISTGFIVSEKQTELIVDYCQMQKEKGSLIFVDPIMGDDGKLYNGLTEKTVDYMKKLCKIADLIVPNITEASFIYGKYQDKEVLTLKEVEEIVNNLEKLGSKNIVITSVNIDNKDCSVIKEEKEATIKMIPFKKLPVRFPGTGDIFSSVLLGKYLGGQNLLSATKLAMQAVEKLISLSLKNEDKFKGIAIENYLDEI